MLFVVSESSSKFLKFVSANNSSKLIFLLPLWFYRLLPVLAEKWGWFLFEKKGASVWECPGAIGRGFLLPRWRPTPPPSSRASVRATWFLRWANQLFLFIVHMKQCCITVCLFACFVVYMVTYNEHNWIELIFKRNFMWFFIHLWWVQLVPIAYYLQDNSSWIYQNHSTDGFSFWIFVSPRS